MERRLRWTLLVLLVLVVASVGLAAIGYERVAYGPWIVAHTGRVIQSPAHRIDSLEISASDAPFTGKSSRLIVRELVLDWLPGPRYLGYPIDPSDWDGLCRGELTMEEVRLAARRREWAKPVDPALGSGTVTASRRGR